MLEPVRAADDKGEVDGYFGQLDMKELQANPANFKRVETPEGKRTTLIVSPTGNGYIWRCKECGEKMATIRWVRPYHVCNDEIKAEFKAREESDMLVSA